MVLQTVADQEYLIRVYRTSDGNIVDYNASTGSDDQMIHFQRLIDAKYIAPTGNGYFRLTPAGLKAAKEAEQLRDQRAECAEADRKKRLFETKRELCISLISAAAGSLLTLLVEHLLSLP